MYICKYTHIYIYIFIYAAIYGNGIVCSDHVPSEFDFYMTLAQDFANQVYHWEQYTLACKLHRVPKGVYVTPSVAEYFAGGGNKLEQKRSSESNFFAQLLYVLSWKDSRKDGQIQKLGP